ncbi:hypothetical protein D3C80_1881040 [compost metagenome]
MRLCGLCRRFNLGNCRFRLAEAYIIPDRAAKQMRLLQHHPYLAVQLGRSKLRDRMRINPNNALRRFIEARNEADERRLTRSIHAYNSDGLASLHFKMNIAQYSLLHAAIIAEANMLE